MGNILVLHPSRGTKLYRIAETPLQIEIGAKEHVLKIEILLIQGEDVSIQKLDIHSNIIQLLPKQEFLCVNLSNVPITLKFNQNTSILEVLFDPYEFENSPFDEVNPEEFKQTHSVPDGYMDILSKWYSIKFTYPTKNLIFIRPHLGVSIQSHLKRSEDWTIVQGTPIIIANSQIFYSVHPGDTFHTDKGKLHSIFNPTNEWVVLEEHYDGQFEEEDIIRVFNPNHYQ